MNILLITYYFYPSEAIGAKRWSGFYEISKNYKDINFTVLTANWVGERYNDRNIYYLGEKIKYTPPKSINKKCHFIDILKHPTIIMRSVDRSLFNRWILDVKKWINSNKFSGFDLIISSYGPMSTVVAGSYAKKIYKTPLIIDLRDLISIQGQKNDFFFVNLIDKLIDKFLCRKADYFLTVSSICQKKAQLFYGKPSYTIYSGIRDDEIKKINSPIRLTLKNKKKVIILYSGTLGINRNPNKILSILNKYSLKKNLKIEVRFASQDNPLEIINPENISNITIKWMGYIPKDQLEKESKACDALLILEDLTEKGDENLTGKIFEYMSLKKPIIASCNPSSEINKVLKETNYGFVIQNIKDCENFFLKDRLLNIEKIKLLTREEQFKKLIKFLYSIKQNNVWNSRL